MDIKQLQYFVVSVDMGSFHSAAETLITTQPNVSKIVKSLEDELGMTLLERTRYGVKITEDGEQIYHYAIEILKNMKVIHNIRRKKNIEKLKVCSIPSNELSIIISRFYAKYAQKNIQVELGEAKVEDILVKIHRRQVDIGFVYISTKNLTAFQHQAESKGMEYHEISRLPLYLFTGKKLDFPEETIGERELRSIKLIQHNEGQYSLYNHLGHLKEDISYGTNKTPVVHTNSDFSLIQFLKNTEYGSIGSCFWKESYEEYGIYAIPIEGCEQRISFGYLKRTRDSFSEIAREFLNYVLLVFNSPNDF